MITLLEKIQDALAADAALSAYVEVVHVGKWRADALPDFETYGIIVSPESKRTEDIAVQQKQDIVTVHIVCLVYNFGDDALNGEAPQGLLKMIGDVFSCLANNDLDGHVELTGGELRSSIALNQGWSPNRDGFFHEAKITAEYYLQPYLG